MLQEVAYQRVGCQGTKVVKGVTRRSRKDGDSDV